ncbi:hypothetical protein [Gemmata sp.]|uniref:hypothetical protein n=1 Tax=Gemmata sp. TaxID=1914242 RepID=UPI003F70B9F0
MLRLVMCALLAMTFGGTAGAGELDRESGPARVSVLNGTPAPALVAGAEMDNESPSQSHYWRGGWGGYYSFRAPTGWGWGGYPGYWGWGYPGLAAYRGWYGGFYPAYPAYASWGWGGWGWRGWYGGW